MFTTSLRMCTMYKCIAKKDDYMCYTSDSTKANAFFLIFFFYCESDGFPVLLSKGNILDHVIRLMLLFC